MKKQFLKLGIVVVLMIAFASCKSTISYQNRHSMSLNEFRVSRNDYKLTEDATASAQVKVTLGIFLKGIDKKNLKQSRIEGVTMNSADEQIAVYELLSQHPEWDYITNVRFVKSFEKTLFTKTYNTKVIAKGIILKANN
jgi:hypothetical protein